MRQEQDLPHSEDAEAVVLGELIDNPALFDDVSEILKPVDFYVNKHRTIYETLLTVYREQGEAPDASALTMLLKNKGDLDQLHDVDKVVSTKDQLWPFNLEKKIQEILGTAMQRRVIHGSREMVTIGYHTTDAAQISRKVESLLYQLTMDHAPQSDFESIDDILHRCMNDIEYAYNHRGTITGVPSGFNDIDRMTLGFQRKDLILLAGRPSMGKTALGMGMGYNAAKAGFAVAVFSLEMGKEQLGARLLSRDSGIASNRIRGGWLEQDDFEKLVESQNRIGEMCIHIDDTSGSPVSSMRSKLRRLKAKIGRRVDLVIVDYLGLMESEDDTPAKRENRNQEIAEISRGLKGLAREFDVPVLALAQLSRAVESRQSKIPQLSDLRDSGSLEQDADIVMFVYRDDYYAGFDEYGKSKSERPGTADIIIAKQRNGPVGEVLLKFIGSQTRFENLEAEAE